MKLEPIADIIKLVKPLLKTRIVFYTALVLALAFWIALLFPDVFNPLGLGAWRVANDALIGWGVITTSALLLIVLLITLDKWISGRLKTGREKRYLRDLLHGLSHRELLYLFQYIKHKTLLVEFDETDPVVGLLYEKGLIYPSGRVRIDSVVSYNSSYHDRQAFEVSPQLHSYLMDHLEIFSKLSESHEYL